VEAGVAESDGRQLNRLTRSAISLNGDVLQLSGFAGWCVKESGNDNATGDL
jgi:hypothetical protein